MLIFYYRMDIPAFLLGEKSKWIILQKERKYMLFCLYLCRKIKVHEKHNLSYLTFFNYRFFRLS